MTYTGVSTADETKELVLARIHALGGKVSGTWGSILAQLDLDVSRKAQKSALWKLREDGVLDYHLNPDAAGCPSSSRIRTFEIAD